MTDLSAFPVARRWPATHPERLQLYSLPTPNGAVGPMFGQVGYFHKFAGRQVEDKRLLERYRGEAKRLLAVLERRLTGRDWIMGDDYTIADISLLGWVRNLIGFYDARGLVAFDSHEAVPAWLDRGLARAAVQRGLTIPSRA